MQAARARLSGGRWHLQHGPIDIVIGAEGEAAAVDAAHAAAWQRFETVLDELVAELPALRSRVTGTCPLRGPVAQRMWWACRPHRAPFITPMAAVAGAVAQELIEAYARPGVRRAWVNNGGDIALHLAPGARVRVGLFADLARFDVGGVAIGVAAADAASGAAATAAAMHIDGHFDVHAAQPVRGIATSGWRGRSLSLGIADSVTVLARTAAEADAAATVIANAVNADDARIRREPANQVRDASDLGEIEVVVDVPPLPASVVRQALQQGERCARALQRAGLIHAAVLVCQQQALRVEGPVAAHRQSVEHGSVFA